MPTIPPALHIPDTAAEIVYDPAGSGRRGRGSPAAASAWAAR